MALYGKASDLIHKENSAKKVDNSKEARTIRLLANIAIPDKATNCQERLYLVDNKITVDFWCDESFYLGNMAYTKQEIEKF